MIHTCIGHNNVITCCSMTKKWMAIADPMIHCKIPTYQGPTAWPQSKSDNMHTKDQHTSQIPACVLKSQGYQFLRLVKGDINPVHFIPCRCTHVISRLCSLDWSKLQPRPITDRARGIEPQPSTDHISAHALIIGSAVTLTCFQ